MSDKNKPHKTTATVFRSERDKDQMILQDGFRFMIICRGSAPKMIPIDEQGIYEVDAAILPSGQWPVIVMSIDLGHVKAWENLPVEQINSMIDAIERSAR